MLQNKILNLIFSSSAAVYGEPGSIPIPEKHIINPVNPYGQTKAIVESILKDYDSAYGLKSICLRYFNACGAHLDGSIGEQHNPETHLIPLILQAASGRKENIAIYGDDYLTNDGTCIRDYIHVMDIAEAHLLALEFLKEKQISEIFNIGNNEGFSVKELIKIAQEITQKKIKVNVLKRRKGDPAQLIANNKKITHRLNWSAQYSDLKTIISSAWQWEQKLYSS